MDADFLSNLLSLADERPHIHGFHSYPARFSPELVAPLLEGLPPKAVVFDPFAGSGTTLVEARLHGYEAWGNDLNPLAVLLCRVKADPLPLNVFGALEADMAYLRKYIGHALRSKDEDEHVKLPTGPRFFQPNVYWELQIIAGGISRLRHPHNQEIFLAALSSIVNRVSIQARDSQPGKVRETQLAQRKTSIMFYEASERLVKSLKQFSALAKKGVRPRVWQTDARRLDGVPSGRVDRIITSPPYGGTYDYAEMHAMRNIWLGLDWAPFEKMEIGARRDQKGRGAMDTFFKDIADVFRAMGRTAKPGAKLYWVIADGVIGRSAYRGDELSKQSAKSSGWRFTTAGQIERPIWSDLERNAYGKRPKHEYLMEFVAE